VKENLILHGMVVYQAAEGENNKRMVVLTKERGKVTMFARGARRPGNANLALGPFATGSFEVMEGKNAYTLFKANISNYFRDLSLDPVATFYGFYFLEAASHYAVENADESEVINLLYASLRALEKKQMPNELIRRIFELKLLAIEGEYPNVFECQWCKKKEDLTYFSFRKAGMVCSDCKEFAKDETAEPILPSAHYCIQYIISSPIKEIFAFSITDKVEEQFTYFVGKYVKMYMGKDFKSLDVLESIEVK